MNRRFAIRRVQSSADQGKRQLRICNFDQRATRKLVAIGNDQARCFARKRRREELLVIDIRDVAFTRLFQIGNPFDPCFHVTHDTAIQTSEIREQVLAAIDKLPDLYRDILMLRDIEELSTEEAARELEITEGAVKTRLHRARLALRESLDPFMRGESQ